jgi:hypothetical protein
MRSQLWACAAALCAVGVGATLAPSQVNVRARIGSGRVIDAGTGRPVDGVSIIIPNARIATRTGTNGTFRLNRVPADSTAFEFRHPCYFPVRVAVPPGADVEIEIGLPFDDASLRRAGCGGLGARSKRDTIR